MASSPSTRRISPFSAAETADSTYLAPPILPPDLIFNILTRLPVRVLGKFKSVSKQWINIISDPYFILTHSRRSLENPNLLLLRKFSIYDQSGKNRKEKTRIEIRALDFYRNHNADFSLDLNDDVDLLPSKWDLICFVGENVFYVCNPSTQEFARLPEASCCTSGEVNAGFGYISSKNEYVLIHLFDRILDFHVEHEIGCEILRLSDGRASDCTWKLAEAICPYVVRGWGILVENVFYWMIWETYDCVENEAIVFYDLEGDYFGTVTPPEECLDPLGVWSLVELRGSLCLVDNGTRPSTMDIWVLKDNKNHKWVKEYSIDLNGFGNEFLKFIIPLDYQGEELLMDARQESLHCYNVETKSFKRLENLIAGEWTWLRLYTESFFYLAC